MKISELSTDELRRALAATEKTAGPYSYEAKVLRRELARRETKPEDTAQKRRGVTP